MNVQVKIGDQTFSVEVGDLSARPILATVEGETYEVWPEEEAAVINPVAEKTPENKPQLAPAPRPAARAVTPVNGDKDRTMTAPIPGAILSVAVQPGTAVSQGQEICVLEAMKMKNAIRATHAGVIAAVLVKEGDHVQKGHPLVEFAE